MATETALTAKNREKTRVPAGALVLAQQLPLDLHPAFVYLAELSKGSLPAQRSALNQIARILGTKMEALNWAALRYQHVQFIRARLAEQYSPTTANRLLTALRRVLHQAWKLGQIPEEEYRKLVDIPGIKVEKGDTEADLTGRALSVGEISAMLSACSQDPTAAGVRDAAIIALGYGLGLRRSEVAKLELDHVDRSGGLVHVRGGKGNKSRTVPIDNGALDAIKDWIKLRGQEAGPLFWGVNKAGQIHSHRLNVKAVDELYHKRAQEAKVADTDFHDLRRSFISDLLDKGADLVSVAKLAGHSDPMTTARYDRRKMDTRRRTIGLLHVPYHKRK